MIAGGFRVGLTLEGAEPRTIMIDVAYLRRTVWRCSLPTEKGAQLLRQCTEGGMDFKPHAVIDRTGRPVGLFILRRTLKQSHQCGGYHEKLARGQVAIGRLGKPCLLNTKAVQDIEKVDRLWLQNIRVSLRRVNRTQCFS